MAKLIIQVTETVDALVAAVRARRHTCDPLQQELVTRMLDAAEALEDVRGKLVRAQDLARDKKEVALWTGHARR